LFSGKNGKAISTKGDHYFPLAVIFMMLEQEFSKVVIEKFFEV
jgi:hypothetical protein